MTGETTGKKCASADSQGLPGRRAEIDLPGSEKRGENRRPLSMPLHGKVSQARDSESRQPWFEALEQVIQQSIRELSARYENSYLKAGIRDLESVIFAQSLTMVGDVRKEKNLRMPPELELFSDRIVLAAFLLHERRYRCVKYSCRRQSPNEQDSGFTTEELKWHRRTIESLSKSYSSQAITLKEHPDAKELLTNLFDHLHEETVGLPVSGNAPSARQDKMVRIHEVHPARRSAVRDWQTRMEAHYTARYDHEEEGDFFYTYPLVYLLQPDGMHLVLLIVSPLDENFVDEKVPASHRCAEICLAIYQLGLGAYPIGLETLTPQLRQVFGRVLFTSMQKEASLSLTSTSEAQSAILRHWVRAASTGYRGIVGESHRGEAFNAWRFCEAIARGILCADISGVDREIYPFDRVFVFQETGSTSRFDQPEPVKLTVMEASVLSTNPADRSQYLTRRERQIRGTEDFECRAAQKVIEDDNCFWFFVHGVNGHLVLSVKDELSKEQRDNLKKGQGFSVSQRKIKDFYYPIDLPDEEDDRELPLVVQNLFGRLITKNYGAKPYPDPLDPATDFLNYEGFTPQFEQRRLRVTERFDETGLYYHYEHGISLADEVPFLHQLQAAYFTYLDQKCMNLDRRFRRETLKQENMTEDQVEQVLARYDQVRRETRQGSVSQERTTTATSGLLSSKAAKVVYIAYSWVLNDANQAMALAPDDSEEDSEGTRSPLLGNEYRYTMILVSDQDPEKSLSQLNAERENLKLFFQLAMQRIWMDRLAEKEFLETRSRTIGHSLGQFVHRAKGLMKDQGTRDEIQNYYDNLRRLMEPQQVTAVEDEINSAEEVFAWLLGDLEHGPFEVHEMKAKLEEQAARWFRGHDDSIRAPHIDICADLLPPVKVRWPVGVVTEAFYVLLKNACEAAVSSKADEKQRRVSIQVLAMPDTSQNQISPWYVDIVLANPGGPIPGPRLERLTARHPKELDHNLGKEGSTGVGVFLARYQLQNMVGRGADLHFANLGDKIVQTRLRLPADLVQPVVEDGDQETIPVPEELEGGYVLYVENSPGTYKPAIAGLRVALPPSVRLEHRQGRDAALELAKTQLPIFVLSDLSIRKDEEGAVPSDRSFGIQFLKRFMQIAHEQGVRPPIWVLTAEGEVSVQKGLGLLANRGYRYRAATSDDPKNLAQPGTLSVFSEKRPDEVKAFEPFLQQIFSPDEVETPRASEPRSDGVATAQLQWTVASLALSDLEADALEDTYLSVQTSQEPGFLVVCDDCTTIGALADSLSRWFQHPKIPVVDSVLSREESLFLPTNHAWHKNLVLALTLSGQLYAQLPVKLLYWALSKNVWLETTSKSHQERARVWRLIRNEDRGPISRLRHDLTNEWSSPDLKPMLEATIEELNACERKLQMAPKDDQALLRSCQAQKASGRYLQELVRPIEVVQVDRSGVRNSLQALEGRLVEALTKESMIQQYVDRERAMLHVLDDYLGGD